MRGGPVAQWLRALPVDKEILGSNPTATMLSGLSRPEMTSAVNVALNKHSKLELFNNETPVNRTQTVQQ